MTRWRTASCWILSCSNRGALAIEFRINYKPTYWGFRRRFRAKRAEMAASTSLLWPEVWPCARCLSQAGTIQYSSTEYYLLIASTTMYAIRYSCSEVIASQLPPSLGSVSGRLTKLEVVSTCTPHTPDPKILKPAWWGCVPENSKPICKLFTKMSCSCSDLTSW